MEPIFYSKMRFLAASRLKQFSRVLQRSQPRGRIHARRVRHFEVILLDRDREQHDVNYVLSTVLQHLPNLRGLRIETERDTNFSAVNSLAITRKIYAATLQTLQLHLRPFDLRSMFSHLVSFVQLQQICLHVSGAIKEGTLPVVRVVDQRPMENVTSVAVYEPYADPDVGSSISHFIFQCSFPALQRLEMDVVLGTSGNARMVANM